MNTDEKRLNLLFLKASGLPLCLLINFGNPKVEVKRLRF